MRQRKEYGLLESLFEEFGDGVKVTLFRKVGNASEKVGNAFEKYKALLEAACITKRYIENIELVFVQCEKKPFGQSDVMRWLGCSKAKATNIMNTMKDAEVIRKVKGYGPGKYEFVILKA